MVRVGVLDLCSYSGGNGDHPSLPYVGVSVPAGRGETRSLVRVGVLDLRSYSGGNGDLASLPCVGVLAPSYGSGDSASRLKVTILAWVSNSMLPARDDLDGVLDLGLSPELRESRESLDMEREKPTSINSRELTLEGLVGVYGLSRSVGVSLWTRSTDPLDGALS